MIEVIVTGKPVAKGRGRVGILKGKGGKPDRGMVFTPSNTRKWEKDARTEARIVMGPRPPLEGPLQIVVKAVFPITAGWPAWKRALAEEGALMHTMAPDGDNVLKAMKDALNGVVYLDDKQVVKSGVVKSFGTQALVKATIRILNGYPSQTTRNPNG